MGWKTARIMCVTDLFVRNTEHDKNKRATKKGAGNGVSVWASLPQRVEEIPF